VSAGQAEPRHGGERFTPLGERHVEQIGAIEAKRVERDVGSGPLDGQPFDSRRRRVNPLLEQAEGLAPAIGVDHDLAVHDIVAGRELQLGEVAQQVLAAT
jgi:hypothetical protein